MVGDRLPKLPSEQGKQSSKLFSRFGLDDRLGKRWSRLRLWQRATVLSGIGLVVLAVAGLIVYLNVAEGSLQSGVVEEGEASDPSASTVESAAGQQITGTLAVWARFESDFLTLDLPAWFVGGRLDDPKAGAALEQLVEMDPHEWLALQTQVSADQSGVDMLMVGSPEADSSAIIVLVGSEEAPLDSSLASYAEEFGAWFAPGKVIVDMTGGEDRLLYEVRFDGLQDPGQPMVSHIALIRSGSHLYMLSYTGEAALGPTLESLFARSIRTVVIKDHDEGETGL